MEAYNLGHDSKERNRFTNTPVFKLIEILKDKCNVYNKDAWKQMYIHYSSHILFHARQRALTIYNDDPENIAQDITSMVLEKMLTKIDTYEIKKNITNPKDQFKVFFGWLMSILENEFINITREQKAKLDLNKEVIYLKKNPIEEDKGIDNNSDRANYASNIPLKSRLNVSLALKKLTVKELHILTAFMDFGIQDKKSWKLPNPYKKILCEKYQCKSNSIDQTKLRAIKKLKKELDQL